MARIFVAVWPPPPIAAALADLPRPDLDDVRWVPRENLHVTLRFLGDVDPDDATMRLRSADLRAASVELGPTVSMLGTRVVMAPVAGLDGLAAGVLAATEGLGRPPGDHPFVGHLTLARCMNGRTGRRVCGAAVSMAFPVHEVAVVSSRTDPHGARYTTVATVPLR